MGSRIILDGPGELTTIFGERTPTFVNSMHRQDTSMDLSIVCLVQRSDLKAIYCRQIASQDLGGRIDPILRF